MGTVGAMPTNATTHPSTTALDVTGVLRVAPSPKHGLGVFAGTDIEAGERIHIAPVMVVTDADVETLDSTPLRGLVYGWDEDHGTSVLALGYGSLFNHAAEPNCVYHRIDAGDIDSATGRAHGFDALEYSTIRYVEADEELTIDYSGGDPSLLWFDAI